MWTPTLWAGLPPIAQVRRNVLERRGLGAILSLQEIHVCVLACVNNRDAASRPAWPAQCIRAGQQRHVCAGQADCFSTVRRLLPGPYTFILQASKNLPKVKIGGKKPKKKQRQTVGVRMPDDIICRELLALLDRCAPPAAVSSKDSSCWPCLTGAHRQLLALLDRLLSFCLLYTSPSPRD